MEKRTKDTTVKDQQFSTDVNEAILLLSQMQISGGWKKFRKGLLKFATAEMISSDFFVNADPNERGQLLDQLTELNLVMDALDGIFQKYPNREIFITTATAKVREYLNY